ncbi:MAG: type II secretion system protein [Desulfobacter sp.]|nr:MAG: type II secretion system protein [Desulfobacter sp.]
MGSFLKNQNGFTIVEIVAVLIILGIITAVAVSRVSFNSPDLAAQAEAIKAHVRYAQTRAMATDLDTANTPTWGIQTNAAGTAYWLYDRNNNRVLLPGAEATTITLASLGLTSMTPFNISFNDWGEPFRNNAILAADLPISINDGSDSEQFTITARTGFIP